MATDKISTDLETKNTEQSNKPLAVLLPYIIAIGAQLPLIMFYYSALWRRPHYQFFPFALLMVGSFLYIRWPKSESKKFFGSSFSGLLFWVGVFFGIMGTLFMTAWFTAASLTLLMTSLFARTRDGEAPSKSLLVLCLPLFTILSLPNNLDSRLITSLQGVSARVSSYYLDLLGFLHHSPGTTLNFPGAEYEIERACSGVQSFFTLIFCTTFFIVAMRRPWFRGLILLVAAGFWAILMNSIRIMVIPIADLIFNLDLKAGLSHELLGYTVMLVACGLILSTDQLLEFVFGRTDSQLDDEEGHRFSRRGPEDDRSKSRPAVSTTFKISAIAGAVILCVFGVVQLLDVTRSMRNPEITVRFFDRATIIDFDIDALPEEIASTMDENQYHWIRRSYERSDRSQGSDLGQRSDSWNYQSNRRFTTNVSIDQTFPGWHELTTCYKHIGWKVDIPRRKRNQKITLEDGSEIDWTFIEIGLIEPTTSRHAFLLFAFTDSDGIPFDAPVDWGNFRSYFERIKNRMSPKFRSRLFRSESYQIQTFTVTPMELPAEVKDEVRSQFFEIRNRLREAVIKYGDEQEKSRT